MNSITQQFVLAMYYHAVGNPIYHIHKAKALQAAGIGPIQSRRQTEFSYS